jgi:Cdc6-like AAA superfamily ATPase
MSTELDDAKDFTELVNAVSESTRKAYGSKKAQFGEVPVSSPDLNPGQVTQYALYGEGYAATTPTVSALPPGRYDICVDSKCVFAVPSLKPSGLLLELPEMRSDYVIQIVENFWNSEKDYKEGNDFVVGGARYSTGIMIFGPPGSGKTKTIQIVSNKLIERGGTVFFASSSPDVVSSFLTDFSKVEKDRKCIVILEDIDSLIQKFGESSYLEMLDSAKTINNVLFIATTNYPELLDPRIYNRPGRLGHVVRIGLPTEKAREAYLKAILKKHDDVPHIVENTEGFTIDHLTALVDSTYRQKKDLATEIKRLRTLFKMPKAGDQVKMGIGSEWDNP